MKAAIALILLYSVEVLCQRKELEADMKAIAGSQFEVVPDNPDETTEYSIQLLLTSIDNYDTKKQELVTSGWLNIYWNDHRYTWKPGDHGNITTLSIPCHDFVKPDVKLFNGISEGMEMDDDVNCVIQHNGKIHYIPLVHFHSHCPIDDPTTDTFECHLQLGSWSHPSHDLMLSKDTHDAFNIHQFKGGYRWEILEHSAEVHNRKYTCCPDMYSDITMNIKIRDATRTPRSRWYHPCH